MTTRPPQSIVRAPSGAVGLPAAMDLIRAALDEQVKPLAHGSGFSVEQQAIREHDWPGRLWRGLCLRPPRQAERRDRGARAGDKSAPRKVGVDPAGQRLNFRPMAKAASAAGALGGFG